GIAEHAARRTADDRRRPGAKGKPRDALPSRLSPIRPGPGGTHRRFGDCVMRIYHNGENAPTRMVNCWPAFVSTSRKAAPIGARFDSPGRKPWGPSSTKAESPKGARFMDLQIIVWTNESRPVG